MGGGGGRGRKDKEAVADKKIKTSPTLQLEPEGTAKGLGQSDGSYHSRVLLPIFSCILASSPNSYHHKPGAKSLLCSRVLKYRTDHPWGHHLIGGSHTEAHIIGFTGSLLSLAGRKGSHIEGVPQISQQIESNPDHFLEREQSGSS